MTPPLAGQVLSLLALLVQKRSARTYIYIQTHTPPLAGQVLSLLALLVLSLLALLVQKRASLHICKHTHVCKHTLVQKYKYGHLRRCVSGLRVRDSCYLLLLYEVYEALSYWCMRP